ncbi:GNAT family N-acetyltransferase [Bacillus thuringiensis]|uniref:GNAT family N-acetyltransferase n=1 Tax=Bacillus thuringiensis TaxID=1428 RepID=UPI003CFC06F1
MLLRTVTKDDIESIRKWRNQNHIRKNFINSNYINKKQQEEWFENYLKMENDIMFIIEETEKFQTTIGTVALYNIDNEKKSAEFGRLMIGYMPCVGKGFGKRAAVLACKYAFEMLNIFEIYLTVLNHNTKAIQLYKDMGFIIKSNSLNEIHMTLSKEQFSNSS